MPAKDNNLRTTVTGTVVGGLILAAVLALVPKAWAGVVWASKAIYGFLWFKISIPIWLILLICFLAALLLTIFKQSQRKFHSVTFAAEEAPVSPPTPDPLSKLELLVISILVKADGKYLGKSEIASSIEATVLLTEQALESLNRRKMLMSTGHYMGYPIFRLSPKGVDYAVEIGLIST